MRQFSLLSGLTLALVKSRSMQACQPRARQNARYKTALPAAADGQLYPLQKAASSSSSEISRRADNGNEQYVSLIEVICLFSDRSGSTAAVLSRRRAHLMLECMNGRRVGSGRWSERVETTLEYN